MTMDTDLIENTEDEQPTQRRRPLHPIAAWLLGLVALATVAASFISASVLASDTVRDRINTFAEFGLYLLALPAAALFCGLYMGFSNWRQTMPGRATAVVGLALTGVLIVNATTLIYGQDYPAREFIRVIAYWGIGFALVYLCYSVWHFQRLGVLERRAQRHREVDDIELPHGRH